MTIKFPLLLSIAIATAMTSSAAIVEKEVPYEDAGVQLMGHHTYDDATATPRPAVLVIHQWTGISPNEIRRSRMLAEMGYNVFAADIYGKGIRPAPPEAGKEAGKYKADRALYRSRIQAALKVLQSDPRTDARRIAVIGYCFGGSGALEAARANFPVAGVVSFHGSLDAAENMKAEAGKIGAKVLVLHGADDPLIPAKDISAFQEEMRAAKADWQMLFYGGAVHAFTQPEAGNASSGPVAYHEVSDRRSWTAMTDFFNEIFADPVK